MSLFIKFLTPKVAASKHILPLVETTKSTDLNNFSLLVLNGTNKIFSLLNWLKSFFCYF